MLLKEIKKFRLLRKVVLIPILLLGILGLIIPIIPGLVFIYVFLVLINPEMADLIKDKCKDFLAFLSSI